MQVGTPPKAFAFEVSRTFNDTTLFAAAGSCKPVTSGKCIASKGGIFDLTTSSTFRSDNLLTSTAPFLEPTVNLSKFTWGRDILSGAPDLTLKDFPLAVSSDGSTPNFNLLSFGRNSTFFDALISQKRIPSRTWSLFYGLIGDSDDTQMDGNLVLGGFDSEKIGSDKALVQNVRPTYASAGCGSGMVVTLSDILMTVPNGGTVSILRGSLGTSKDVCLLPAYPVINLPGPVWDAFQANAGGDSLFVKAASGPYAISRSVGIFPGGMLGYAANASKSYTGNITFVFTPDVSITIPSHQFVRKDWFYDDDGHLYDYNSSFRVYRLSKLEQGSANDIPIFGQPFFTGAYLQVDEEKGNFRLSTNRLVSQENITAINSSSCAAVDITPSSTTSPAQPSPGRRPSYLTVPTVIGIVVCVVFTASVIAGTWFWRRRAARRVAQDKEEVSTAYGGKSELADDGIPRPPVELDTQDSWLPKAKIQELPAVIPGEREGRGGRSELPNYVRRDVEGLSELQAIRARVRP
ncbi:hypothetical protein GP486_004657 [Trichoglossum hirsutum]|uniref:Peptidase A1 domain-containing protein n=1 Tax=Trichoglossum hirsutum TaxID=265104 RepID=A0A9P8LAS4_9PEZI|nr:hypothetical protein GP486_004657 [Trichoglossum hirsutum]